MKRRPRSRAPGWRALAKERRPERDVPLRLTDDAEPVYRPWEPGDEPDSVDRAIIATRRAVFPLHGLDPDDPRD